MNTTHCAKSLQKNVLTGSKTNRNRLEKSHLKHPIQEDFPEKQEELPMCHDC